MTDSETTYPFLNTVLTIGSRFARRSSHRGYDDFTAALDSRLRAMGISKPGKTVRVGAETATSPGSGWVSAEVSIDESVPDPEIRLSFMPVDSIPGIPLQAILGCVEDCLDGYAEWSFKWIELKFNPLPRFDDGDYAEGQSWAELQPAEGRRAAHLSVTLPPGSNDEETISSVMFTGATDFLVPDPESYEVTPDGAATLPVWLPQPTLKMAALLFDLFVHSIDSSSTATTASIRITLDSDS